jgi:hypothetical protein
MTAVFSIVECEVTYNDGSTEIRRPTYSEVAVGLATVDKVSVIRYLQENLTNVKSIRVIDTLYFKTESDYLNYLKTQ